MKDPLKQTLVEVIEELRSLFHEIMTEAMEDVALLCAIEEGEKTDFVFREQCLIFSKRQVLNKEFIDGQ